MAQTKRKSFHWWLLGLGGGLLVLDVLFYFAVLAPTRRVYASRETEHQSVMKMLTEKKKMLPGWMPFKHI